MSGFGVVVGLRTKYHIVPTSCHGHFLVRCHSHTHSDASADPLAPSCLFRMSSSSSEEMSENEDGSSSQSEDTKQSQDTSDSDDSDDDSDSESYDDSSQESP